MKRLLAVALAASLVFAFVPVAAAMPSERAAATAHEVVPLGFALDHGRLVQGFAIIHKRVPGVPAVAEARGGIPAKPAKPTADDKLYAFIARGARWRVAEDYVVDAANGDGASDESVYEALQTGMATWQSQVSFDIFGELQAYPSEMAEAEPLVADWDAPDDSNEIYFSSTEFESGSNVVAVTIVWGVFGGPPSGREIVECDMVFNDFWLWGYVGDPAADATIWDVENIAVHELGHVVGLGDLYETAAVEQTMYGYASPGEIIKRDLGAGDIAGIKELYK